MAKTNIIASTIWKQLTSGGIMKVLSWGIPLNTRVGIDEEDGSGWLRFEVSGMKFTGLVKIIYNPSSDLYTVEYFKDFSKEKTDSIENVFCDDLTRTIDEYVEKVPEYKY